MTIKSEKAKNTRRNTHITTISKHMINNIRTNKEYNTKKNTNKTHKKQH